MLSKEKSALFKRGISKNKITPKVKTQYDVKLEQKSS